MPKVYLDETGFDTFYYRPYAYALRGQIVKARISGKRYERMSLVAARADGKLIAPMVYKGTMDSSLFEAWFGQFLLKELKEPSVIIMDNARFHRMAVLREMAQRAGHIILPLPPYSPELNPIEKVWANIKRHLRKVMSGCLSFEQALLDYFLFCLTIRYRAFQAAFYSQTKQKYPTKPAQKTNSRTSLFSGAV